jgi:hypothetical protein
MVFNLDKSGMLKSYSYGNYTKGILLIIRGSENKIRKESKFGKKA